jgi:beta-glucanase (GH16 family)
MKKRLFSVGIFVLIALISSNSLKAINWAYETGGGGWGNAELEYYKSSGNATLTATSVVITAKRESYGGYAYTSARVHSTQSWTYGYVSCSAQCPAVQGLWPAFWMLGSNIGSVGWPSCGEIDIMEQINTSRTNYGTMHWNVNGHVSYGGSTSSGTGYHTYAINWNTSAITWYVDGRQYLQGNIANNINSTGCFHKAFYILVNMAVGGNWPGNTIGALPATLYVTNISVTAAKDAEEQIAEPAVQTVSVNMFPNPNNGDFNIKLNQYDETSAVEIKIYDLRGSNVYSSVEKSSDIALTTGLKAGIYCVRVTNGKNVAVNKIVIH